MSRTATTVQADVDAFLPFPAGASPDTRRGYAGVLDRLAAKLDPGRPLAGITGDEIAALLEQPWAAGTGDLEPQPAAVSAGLSRCAANRLHGPVLPAGAERRRENTNATRAVSRPAIERALSRRATGAEQRLLPCGW